MRSGFTLIELLLSMAIIGVLAAIVIVAINPQKQLGAVRDARRRSDANTILNAVSQYRIDNDTSMPCAPSGSPCIDTTWRMLGAMTEGCDVSDCDDGAGGNLSLDSSCLHLRSLSGTYVTTVPADPRYGSGNAIDANSKSYYAIQAVSGRVTVRVCLPEGDDSISVTR